MSKIGTRTKQRITRYYADRRTSREQAAPLTRGQRRMLFHSTAVCLLIGLIGVGISTKATFENNAQNKFRDSETAANQQCYTIYAAEQTKIAEAQRPLVKAYRDSQGAVLDLQVRNSLEQRRVAVKAKARGEALSRLLVFITKPESQFRPKRGAALVGDLLIKQRHLVRAEARALPVQRSLTGAYRTFADNTATLQTFSDENPPPEPPSNCLLKREAAQREDPGNPSPSATPTPAE